MHLRALVCGAVAAMMAGTAFAQRPAPAAPAPQPQQQQQQLPQQQLPTWESFPNMLLERIYRGPLKDTIIERLRDPIDGSVCYVYLPISVPQQPEAGGYAQYGAATVGSISCVHTTEVLQLMDNGNPPRQGAPAKTH
jgi:hypothetical protein